jgi:hypothetical protein
MGCIVIPGKTLTQYQQFMEQQSNQRGSHSIIFSPAMLEYRLIFATLTVIK